MDTDQQIINAAVSAYGMMEQYWLEKIQALRLGQEDAGVKAERARLRQAVEALDDTDLDRWTLDRWTLDAVLAAIDKEGASDEPS